MLTLQTIRERPDYVIERLTLRNFRDAEVTVQQILNGDNQLREAKTRQSELQAEANRIAKDIPAKIKADGIDSVAEMRARGTQLKTEVAEMDEAIKAIADRLEELIIALPNLPCTLVKAGKSAEDNETVDEWGTTPELHPDAKPHWELASQYGLIGFELGNKVTGAGFPFYRGKGSRLQRALIWYFLEKAGEQGYTEYQAPLMVNAESGRGTGQLPDKEGQMYHITADNLYMIPTAEVPLTNIYRDVILKAADLPIKLTGYTPCFRREAGSYGANVRGLNRLHQFDKVEIVQIVHPAKSYEVLETMRAYVGSLLQSLGLKHRTLRLCAGDMGFTSAMTYDFEVWSAAQQRWLEVSSVSNFETFQANRLNLRFKDESGKNQLAHTLNGSALALPRIVAALLENNQTPDGITIPEVLRPYTGFDIID